MRVWGEVFVHVCEVCVLCAHQQALFARLFELQLAPLKPHADLHLVPLGGGGGKSRGGAGSTGAGGRDRER